jgi:hypothetical protein
MGRSSEHGIRICRFQRSAIHGFQVPVDSFGNVGSRSLNGTILGPAEDLPYDKQPNEITSTRKEQHHSETNHHSQHQCQHGANHSKESIDSPRPHSQSGGALHCHAQPKRERHTENKPSGATSSRAIAILENRPNPKHARKTAGVMTANASTTITAESSARFNLPADSTLHVPDANEPAPVKISNPAKTTAYV